MKKLAVMVGAVVALGWSVATATTFKEIEVQCPLDGTALRAKVINSTNNFGGQDRDFFRQAEPFMLTATTCPTCLYSGTTADFQAGPDGGGPEISDAVRRAVLERHALVVPDGGSIEEPWVRLALAAQVADLRGDSPEDLGWARLQVSWAVRITDETLQPKPFDDPAFLAIRKRPENPAMLDLESAAWLTDPKRGALTRDRATLAASLLRVHGEHEALLALMPKLRAVMDPKTWPAQEAALRKSIERERDYQRQAQQAFEAALASGTPPANPEAPAVLTYLVGELSRRLGDDAKARLWLTRAPTISGAPAFLATYAKEQLARLPAAKPGR